MPKHEVEISIKQLAAKLPTIVDRTKNCIKPLALAQVLLAVY